ncbi:hypothetical protein RRG08_064725 [Elysia crispata]|uniref:Uncharacterized protein n=1 Tax=Elysia crispata TaxID=231223 RepID=A0AAE0YZC8_9GAST|nr:hypothetical protein RRG08_064725 [Elysia crispata]
MCEVWTREREVEILEISNAFNILYSLRVIPDDMADIMLARISIIFLPNENSKSTVYKIGERNNLNRVILHGARLMRIFENR